MQKKFNPFTRKFDYYERSTNHGVLASAPLSAEEADTYVNSVDNGFYVYYGGTWQLIATLTPAAHDYWVLEDGTFVVFDNAGGSKVIVN